VRKIYHNLMREYENSRNQAEAALTKQKAIAYEKIPKLAEIDKNLGTLGVSLARLALVGNAEGMLKAREESTRLKEERHALLAGHGLEINTPKYQCKSCADTGYIQNTPTSPAVTCVCLKQRLINEYYNLSNMKEVLQIENFDQFDDRLFSTEIIEAEGLSPKMNIRKLHHQAMEFVQNFGEEFVNFLLYGEPGLGKTFICHCIAKDLLDMGHTVLYLTVPRLCKFIEDYRFNRESLAEPDEMMDAIDEADLLILDDLGSEISTVVTSSALFDIINQRLISRKATIVSTNLTPDALASQYSERIVSRFIGNYEMIKFFGEDIRVKKKYRGLRTF